MGYLVTFLLGIIAGLVLSEYLPSEIVNRIGNIKIKKNRDSKIQIPIEFDPDPIEDTTKKKKLFLWGVFNKKKN